MNLNIALSKTFGLFVAAITRMPLSELSNPSISVRSWFKVCSRSSLEFKPPLLFARASISSMKIMQGAEREAFSNNDRIRAAPLPTIIIIIISSGSNRD
jgi:hypothetical protein